MNSLKAGLVALDTDGKWLGGRYYLQHIVLSVAQLPAAERIGLFDVWWNRQPLEDPFREVREHIQRRHIRPPATLLGRAVRWTRRKLAGSDGASDLFRRAGIDAVFPVEPCDNTGVAFAYWAPDFQHRLRPDFYPSGGTEAAEGYFRDNLDRADAVVVSSNLAVAQLGELYPQHAEKAMPLRFCSVPTSEWWQAGPAETAARHSLPEQFFLVCNQYSHHKNHRVVYEAVRLLKERGRPVTVACTGSTYGYRGPDYFEKLESYRKQHRLEEEIRVLGMLPRQEQIALMRRAAAVLQPSLFEGWSTVIEDCRSLGKPFIASDIPVNREQAGAQANLLPPEDPEAWAAEIDRTRTQLPPGPDREAERRASEEIPGRMLSVGRAFAEIVRRAVERREARRRRNRGHAA